MIPLVLSLFSGVGSLDEGFREAGWCVVSAGDVAYSSLYDVRRFHPPAGVFDGIIGGDPCQSHSSLANLVRAKGLEPSFPDLTPEFQRIIEEARPRWFLRENVPRAPDIKPDGYSVRSFLLDHSTMDSGDGTGHEQMRRRRFWFGVNCQSAIPSYPELRAFIDFALHVLPEPAVAVDAGHDYIDGAEKIARRRQAVCGDQRAVPVALGGSGKRKASTSCDGRRGHREGRKLAVSSTTAGPSTKDARGLDHAPRYSLDEMLELQGLPKEIFDYSPLTVQGKRKLVGNAVPLPMARALAKAVQKAMG